MSLHSLCSSLSNGCSVFVCVCAEYFTSNPSRHATSISIYLFASFYLPQNLLIFSEVIFSLPFSLSLFQTAVQRCSYLNPALLSNALDRFGFVYRDRTEKSGCLETAQSAFSRPELQRTSILEVAGCKTYLD